MKTFNEKHGTLCFQLLSLLGTLYCLANAFGAELLCGTRGCEIYAGYGLFGISFYWYGFAGFSGLLLLSFFRLSAVARPLLSSALGLALLLDSLFLIYQTLLWPCSSCHLVALLIGILAVIGIRYLQLPGRKVLLGLGVVWSLFFVYVSIAVVKEVAFPPWALYGSSAAPVKVYFSPTCPACEEVVGQLLTDQPASEQTALYPIAKNKQDEARLARLLSRGKDELEANDILQLFSEANTAKHSLDLASRWRLLSNKMFLARSDATKVPMIISPDILTVGQPDETYSLPLDNLWGSPAGLSDDSGCSFTTAEENCEQ